MHPEEEDDDDDDDPSKEEGALPAFAHAAELFATVRQIFFLHFYQNVEFFFLKKNFRVSNVSKKKKEEKESKM